MIIRNNLAKEITVVLNNKTYVWGNGTEIEVSEAEATWILRIQPSLVAVEPKTVEIHTEPEEIKVVKNVRKNKKQGK